MLVHFPIALVAVGLFFEIIFYRKGDAKPVCGEIILYLAFIAALAALATGMLFTRSFAGEALVMRERHAMLATLSTVFLFLTSAVYLYQRFGRKNKKKQTPAGLILYIISFALVSATGFLGGNLVYSFMIGI
jgi:uncharacterized membrane protein